MCRPSELWYGSMGLHSDGINLEILNNDTEQLEYYSTEIKLLVYLIFPDNTSS